jgi:hypothetical protein
MSTFGGTSKRCAVLGGAAARWAVLRSNVVKLGVLALPLMLISASASAQTFSMTMSSGPFMVPSFAKSVDWALVNNSKFTRTVRVTVYQHLIGFPRTAVVPGPLTYTVAPNETIHNANSVGPGQPFSEGGLYEVQVETNSARVHPLVTIWDNFGNVIPGTSVPAGVWVRVN